MPNPETFPDLRGYADPSLKATTTSCEVGRELQGIPSLSTPLLLEGAELQPWERHWEPPPAAAARCQLQLLVNYGNMLSHVRTSAKTLY